MVSPLGYATKHYTGPGWPWVQGSLGGVFYEVFWCLAVVIVVPKTTAVRAAMGVFGVTILIEFLQLWRTPWLDAARATLPGRTLLGDTFDWWDFPHYAAGCALGALLVTALRRAAPVRH